MSGASAPLVELVEAAVDGVRDLRRWIKTHGERRAKARTRRLRDDCPVADARTRQDRGVEDLHGLGRELEHQGLVSHYVAQQCPHCASVEAAQDKELRQTWTRTF
jgi:plasmid stabilization system protein ParE